MKKIIITTAGVLGIAGVLGLTTWGVMSRTGTARTQSKSVIAMTWGQLKCLYLPSCSNPPKKIADDKNAG